MPDLEVPCVQCRENFLFSEKEQEIFYQKNLPAPQRCAKCRSAKVTTTENLPPKHPQRFEIICDHCGKHDQVPFQPKVGRSVLCKECHQASRSKTRVA